MRWPFGSASRHRRGASLRNPRLVRPQRPPLAWGRILRWPGVLLVLAGLAYTLQLAGQRLLDPGVFPLRQVHIDGALRNVGENDVQAVLEPFLGQNFFTVDMMAVHKAFAASPWIDSVAVRRVWPESLHVVVRERVAYAHWGESEMLDTEARRFRPTSIRETGPWPRLQGPDGHERLLMERFEEINGKLSPLGLRVVRLVEDRRRAWSMTFDNGLEIYMGRDQFDARLRRFTDLYPRLLAQQADRIAAVDLRYINGFAVRWKVQGTNSPS